MTTRHTHAGLYWLVAILAISSCLSIEAASKAKAKSKSHKSPSPSPSPDKAATTQPTLLQFLSSDPQFSLWSMLVGRFPEIAVAYADPNLVATVFLPNDTAIMMSLGRESYQDTVAFFQDTSDITNPAIPAMPGMGGSYTRRMLYQMLSMHSLVNNTILTLADLAKGVTVDTSSVLYTEGPDGSVVAKNASLVFLPKKANERQLFYSLGNPDMEAYQPPILQGDIKAGKCIVHIVPLIIPPTQIADATDAAALDEVKNITGFCSRYNDHFADIAKVAAEAGFDIDNQTVSLNFFCPRTEALERYAKAHNFTIAEMLANTTACIQFLKAHSALTGMARTGTAPAMFTNDLIALGAANNRKEMFRVPMGFLNMNSGTPLANLVGLTPSPIVLSVKNAAYTFGGERTLHTVTDLLPGGFPLIGLDEATGDIRFHVAHFVSDVLPFEWYDVEEMLNAMAAQGKK